MKIEVENEIVHEVERAYYLITNPERDCKHEKRLDEISRLEQHVGEIVCAIIMKGSKGRRLLL